MTSSPACLSAVPRAPGPPSPQVQALWALLAQVSDPEIPVISLLDLGVVREVSLEPEGWVVVITPTYSGCPAMSQMAEDIVSTLRSAGCGPGRVQTQLAPAWSTDWISPEGRRKLREYGIAPPAPVRSGAATHEGLQVLRFLPRKAAAEAVPCPLCGSEQTVETSHFGSTACKALYRCLSCREPFDYFKPY